MCWGTRQMNICRTCFGKNETVVWLGCSIEDHDPDNGICDQDVVCPRYHTREECKTCSDELWTTMRNPVETSPGHAGFALPVVSKSSVRDINPSDVRYVPVDYTPPRDIEPLMVPTTSPLPAYTDISPPTYMQALLEPSFGEYEAYGAAMATYGKAIEQLRPIQKRLRYCHDSLHLARDGLCRQRSYLILSPQILNVQVSIQELLDGYEERCHRAIYLASHYDSNGDTDSVQDRAAMRRELMDTWNQSVIHTDDYPDMWAQRFTALLHHFEAECAKMVAYQKCLDMISITRSWVSVRANLVKVSPCASNDVECIVD